MGNKAFDIHWRGTANEDEATRIRLLWFDALGVNTPCSTVGRQAVRAVLEEWSSSGLAGATLNRRVAVLSRILTTARDLGYCDKMTLLPRWKEKSGAELYMTPTQEEALFEQEMPPSLRNGIVFLLETGCRVGEMFSVARSDIVGTLAKPVWMLRGCHTKTGESRTLPLTQAAWNAFQQQQRKFLSDPDVQPWKATLSRSQFSHAWRKAREQAGLPNLRLHDLRHTFASRLVQRGVSLYVVQRLLGHSNAETTTRYAHLDTAALSQALNI